jgi:hypothetical protein
MGKKDLANVTADLSALASMMPTQRPVTAPSPPAAPVTAEQPTRKAVAAPKLENEDITQFSLSLRKSLRKQLASLAASSDMTMRAFVLNALKEKGLAVRDDDLADLRKERR